MPLPVKRADALTPASLRAARALLDWTQPQLAEAAAVSVRTVKMVEMPDLTAGELEPLRCRPATAERLLLALQRAGIGMAWHGGVLAVTLDTAAPRHGRR